MNIALYYIVECNCCLSPSGINLLFIGSRKEHTHAYPFHRSQRYYLDRTRLPCRPPPAHAQTIYNETIFRIGGAPVGSSYFSNVITTVDKIAFSLNTPGNLIIDLLSSESPANASTPATPIDVNGDGEIAFMDTSIYLFKDDGHLDPSDLVASNDDAGPGLGLADGSINGGDSYLSLTNLAAGKYILAVGVYSLDVNEAIAGINPSGRGPATILMPYPNLPTVNDHGDYRVTFTGSVTLTPAAVPEPGNIAILVGAAVAGAGFARKRRNRS